MIVYTFLFVQPWSRIVLKYNHLDNDAQNQFGINKPIPRLYLLIAKDVRQSNQKNAITLQFFVVEISRTLNVHFPSSIRQPPLYLTDHIRPEKKNWESFCFIVIKPGVLVLIVQLLIVKHYSFCLSKYILMQNQVKPWSRSYNLQWHSITTVVSPKWTRLSSLHTFHPFSFLKLGILPKGSVYIVAQSW